MILLIYQVIDVSITFLSFENVLRIDVREYHEHLTYPAITLRLAPQQDLVEGKYEKMFNKKCFDQFLNKYMSEELNTTEKFIDCIYSNKNVSRDLLLKYPTFDEINQYVKLDLNNNNNSFNSLNTRLIKGLDLRNSDSNFEKTMGPKKLVTIIFDEELIKSIEANENLLTIILNTTANRKIKNIDNYDSSNYLVNIHCAQLPLSTNDDYYGVSSGYRLLTIHKTVQLNLEFPYGNCIHYKSNTSPFNSISQSHCLRKCSKLYLKNFFKCSPLILNGFISDLDKESNEMKYCSREINDLYNKLINEKEVKNECQQLCPRDCIFINFKVIKFYDYIDENSPSFKSNINTTKLFWNTEAPMLTTSKLLSCHSSNFCAIVEDFLVYGSQLMENFSLTLFQSHYEIDLTI